MLENNKCNLGREYEFYATIPQSQRSKGGAAVSVKKISSGGLQSREKKKTNMLNISTSNRQSNKGRYKRSPGTAPGTCDTAERLQRTQPTVGK